MDLKWDKKNSENPLGAKVVTKPAPRPTGGVFVSPGSLFSPPG